MLKEAQRSAIAKAKELGFDLNRSIVTLDESFINLTAARATLIDAIEKKKLIQLPITVQNFLLECLQGISKSLTSLIGGTDGIENLVTRIEQLNTIIWQYGMHNLSEEVLGYQTKLNQLKSQELEAIKLREELEKGIEQKKELEAILNQARHSTETLQTAVANSEEHSEKLAEHLARTTDGDQKAAALLATIQQSEANSTQLLANTRANDAEVTSLDAKIREFYQQVDEYRTKITSTTQDAEKMVQANKTETAELISALKTLEEQIKVQIEKATGFSLFHSFQTRQDALVKSKWQNLLTTRMPQRSRNIPPLLLIQ